MLDIQMKYGLLGYLFPSFDSVYLTEGLYPSNLLGLEGEGLELRLLGKGSGASLALYLTILRPWIEKSNHEMRFRSLLKPCLDCNLVCRLNRK